MSYDVIERSNASGLPVALYEFIFGTKVWRYCSDEENHTIGGVEYEALAISDSGIKQSGDASSDEMTVTMPKGTPVAAMLNGQAPSQTIWLTIRRWHRGDTDRPITWIGYIVSRKQVDEISASVSCKVLTSGFDRSGLRLSYGRQCPHALYDISCKVPKASYGVTFQVTSIVGNLVTATALGGVESGRFTNGFFEWYRYEGALERRAIETHSGTQFRIMGTGVGLSAGTWITAYPGCGRNRSDCKNKFNNLSNYGGIPHLPGSSPFSGDPLF